MRDRPKDLSAVKYTVSTANHGKVIELYDEETEQLSDDVIEATGKVADLTKVASNNFAGVSLWADAAQTQYRSLVDYLGDIAKIWDEIDAKSQTQLLEKLFGKRGASVGSAILQNFDQVEAALRAMEDAGGSADREMGIIRDSIDFKLNELKETWVGTLQEIIQRKDLRNAIGFLTELSNVLGAIIKQFGLFGSIGAGLGIAGIVKSIKPIRTFFKDIRSEAAVLTGVMDSLKAIDLGEGSYQILQLSQGIDGLSAAQAKLVLSNLELDESGKKLTAEQIEQVLAAASLREVRETITMENVEAMASELGLSEAKKQEALATIEGALSEEGWNKEKLLAIASGEGEAATIAQSILAKNGELVVNGELIASNEIMNTLLKEQIALRIKNALTNPWLWAGVAVAATIALVVAMEKLDHSVEELVDDAKKANDAFSNSNSKVQSLSEELETCQDRLKELQALADAGTISIVEQDELNNLILENDELERQIALEKEKASLNARKAMDDANTGINKTVQSKYLRQNYYSGAGDVYEDWAQVTLPEELRATIAAYQEYTKQIDELDKAFKNHELTLEEYEKEHDRLQKAQTSARDYAADLNEQMDVFLTAYKNGELYSGIDSFTQTERENYQELKTSAENYFSFLQNMATHKANRDALKAQIIPRIDTRSSTAEYLEKELISFIDGLTDEQYADISTRLDWSKIDPKDVISKIQELLNAEGPIDLDVDIEFNKTEFAATMDEFENLQKLYNSTFEKLDGKDKLESPIDISEIDALREMWGGFSEFEHLEDLLSTIGSSSDEIQESFNKLATEYTNAKIKVDAINDSNKELIASQMELDGITKESARSFTDFYAGINKLKSQESLLDDAVHQAIGMTMGQMGEGGAVDLTLRPVIDASELEKYGWTPGDGIATLFSSTYSNEAGTIAMNFTPIIADENGNYVGALTEEELTRYAEEVIAGVREDDLHLKIGATFEGEDAIDKAVDAADRIHELQEAFYSDGGIDLSFVADQSNLESLAATLGVCTESLAGYIFQKQAANMATIDTSQDAADLLALATQGQATSTVLEALSKLMNMLGDKEQAVQDFIRTGEQSYLLKAQNLDWQIKEQMDIIQGAVENQTAIEPVTVPVAPKADTKNAGGAGKAAGDAYKDAFEKELEKLKNAYERGDISLKDYLAQWKALIQKFFADNPKYAEEYANQMKSYLDAVKGYYSGAISGVTTILQGRISSLQKQKDKAIKQLEKEKEAALEAYDVQIKAIEKTIKAKQKQIKQLEKEKKAIEALKKPLEEEIQKIRDANEERNRQLQLQKDLYELEKLQNQRTQLVKVLPTFAVMR